jgi:hypothetical protein
MSRQSFGCIELGKSEPTPWSSLAFERELTV